MIYLNLDSSDGSDLFDTSNLFVGTISLVDKNYGDFSEVNSNSTTCGLTNDLRSDVVSVISRKDLISLDDECVALILKDHMSLL